LIWSNNIINRPYRRPQSGGFSYIEVLLASVIMSVLLVSGLKLFANLGRSQQATVSREEAGFLVINMFEEIKRQAYKDPTATDDTLGREAGEIATSRTNYNDIDDYQNWSATPPEDQAGQPYDQYSHLARSVSIQYVMANDFSQPAATDEGLKEITITISRSPSNETVEERKFVLANYERQ